MNVRTARLRLNPAIVSGAMALALASLMMLFASSWEQTGSPEAASSAADEAAVRAVPQLVVDAWARGDGAAVAAAFTDDVDFIAGDGRLVQGRDALVPYFQDQFDGWLAGSRSVAEVVHVRFLRDDVAVVHTLGGIMFPGETEIQPDWVGIQTWVVVEENGEWRAAAYQNSRVLPDVQAATPLPE
ncbi:MAG: SgcJ/EcaC family oxidoreductase [Thermomicrobiales bacterium]